MYNKDIYVFGLSASQQLAKEVSHFLGVEQKVVKTTRFADGEILVESIDSARGKEIYVIQSTSMPVNENLMELLIAIDPFKRGSAEKINVVIPYYGYARQKSKR
ncbi:ribose-phosphate pyrophosphokinase-like domain-containing protein [Mycoplasma capricolum]|uniref:ribose-phosphate pyrophosphokinase-like domain-containing protein n=1 Tax=Mycoplasma capricolum TaxID=2095 RepID=UPI003A5C1F84